MRLLVFLAALFLSTTACAQLESKPDSKPILEKQSFETMQEAAVKGLLQCYHFSDLYECGGVIYKSKKNGTYRVTVPTSSHSQNHVTVPMLEYIEGYGRPLGDYHTHPCNPNMFSMYFSPDDMYGNSKFGDIGYMADLCNGKVHEYNPHKHYKMVTVSGVDFRGHDITADVTEGSVVGSIPVGAPPAHSLFEIIQEATNGVGDERKVFTRNPFLDAEQQHPLVDAKSFDTEDDAAIYGEYLSIHLSAKVEYGGLVLKDTRDGQYHITVPVTSHQEGTVTSIPFDVDDYDDHYLIVAWYHTHVCSPNYISGFFSIPDIAQSQYHHIDAYMLSGCTGNIFKWQFDVDPTEDHVFKGDHGMHYLTRGHQVGWLPLTIKHD